MRHHWGVIPGILIGYSLSTLAGCSTGTEDHRPNIIVVMVDALRRDHLGTYGYDQPTSPYLDSLAENALVFEDAWSQGSQTVASTASLFTSSFFPPVISLSREEVSSTVRDHRLGEGSGMNVLLSRDSSFPRALSNAGYSTMAFLTNPHHHRYSGFPDLFDAYLLLLDGEAVKTDKEIPYADGGVVLGNFQQWLGESHQSKNPYMAYVHLMDVHNPYRPPRKFRERFVTSSGVDLYRNAIPPPDRMPSDSDLEYMTQSYDAEIAFEDSLIRELHTAAVAASSRPLVLVVTSDHGDEFLDHGGLGHGRTLEIELLRVPLIVHGTGFASRRERNLVRLVDVGPSFLELAGVPVPQDWEGRPVFRSMPESDLIAESIANYSRLMSITTTDWHAVWSRASDTIVLYDRRHDPRGLVDVSVRFPGTVDTFRDRFADLNRRRRAARDAVEQYRESLIEKLQGVEPDAATEEQLRALGYVN